MRGIGARGSLTLEAMLCLAALLAVVGLLVTLWVGISADARAAESGLLSFLGAEACALYADVLFSNAGGQLEASAPCASAGSTVSSSAGGKFSSAAILSPQADFDGRFLRVKVNDHYK